MSHSNTLMKDNKYILFLISNFEYPYLLASCYSQFRNIGFHYLTLSHFKLVFVSKFGQMKNYCEIEQKYKPI